MGPHGWPDSVMPLATAEWLICQLSKEKELSSEASTQHMLNTVEFLTDWPCSHFFLRYGNYVKKKEKVCLSGKELFPLGHTHKQQFTKTEENLYEAFPAVFIMPKAFVQNHFLLSCFCQPGAPYMSLEPRGSRESLFSTEQTRPNLCLYTRGM